MFIFSIIILGHLNLAAQVIQDDIYSRKHNAYSFEEVCKWKFTKEYPLISKNSITTLECMGRVMRVLEFCQAKESQNPYLIRGIVKNDRVWCLSASRVIFKYKCANNSRYCHDAQLGCYELKDSMANRLKVVHASLMTLNKHQKVLNCYFDVKDIAELPVN